MTAQLTDESIQATIAEPAGATDRGRLRGTWHRIRVTVQDMNHASRRVVEVQAPWSVDQQWHSR